ncbi:hypothetical protein V8E52_003682 [Russula decolorans]|jgi:hypothetical protein
MHQYKTIAQTLLLLSILNAVFAAPVVPQEVCDTDNDVMVIAEDATTVSERRQVIPPDGTTPSQYSSPLSDGSPPHDSLPLEEPALLQGSAPSSGSPSSHLSATDGQAPVHDSTMEASTSTHPLSAADEPAPVPVSNTEASTSSLQPLHVHSPVHGSTAEPAEGSTTPHYTAITPDMLHRDPNARSMTKKIGGLTLVGGVIAAVVLLSALHGNHNNSTGG